LLSLTDDAETSEQCSTSLAVAPTTLNAHALLTETNITLIHRLRQFNDGKRARVLGNEIYVRVVGLYGTV
jgi:hypothetical protein